MPEKREPAIHPSSIIIVLILMGLTTLFVSVTAAYVYNRVNSGEAAVQMPWLFALNTIFLLAASYAMIQARKSFQLKFERKLLKELILCVLATLIFFGLQILSWYLLFSQEVFLSSSINASYLYFLSALHLAHVVVGLPFLGYFIWLLIKAKRGFSTMEVFFGKGKHRRLLRNIAVYWHFIDALWIYLVVFLLVNSFI